MLPRFILGADLEKNTFGEWIQLINRFEVGVSTIRDQPVDLLYVLGNHCKSFFKLIEALVFEDFLVLFASLQVLFEGSELLFLVEKFGAFLPVEVQDLYVGVGLVELGR